MVKGTEREEVRVTVPVEWWMGELANQLADKPRRRPTRGEIFYRKLSEIEERKGRLIELFRAGKLTRRFDQISRKTKGLIKEALGTLDRQENNGRNLNRVAEEAASHYWFHYNPEIREETRNNVLEGPSEWYIISMEPKFALWEEQPKLETYLDQVPPQAQELVHLYLRLRMIGAQTIPPELKLDNAV